MLKETEAIDETVFIGNKLGTGILYRRTSAPGSHAHCLFHTHLYAVSPAGSYRHSPSHSLSHT
jgi:hypothetical protein